MTSTSIAVFLDGDGRVKQLPVPNRTKIPVLEYLAGKFEPGRTYTEKEVNAILSAWHTFGDYYILRRLLIDHGMLERVPDGSRYWVNEQRGKEKPTWTEEKS